MQDKLLCIGKIVGIHGIKGDIKVLSYAESIDIFKTGSPVLRTVDGIEKTFNIQWIKPHKQFLLMRLKEYQTINAAESLKGSEILINRKSLPDLEEGTYYWTDLIGLSVFTTDDDSYLGCLESIFSTGSNDIYVVKEGKNETLIPALESVVVAVDLEKKIMRVNLPEGLLNSPYPQKEETFPF